MALLMRNRFAFPVFCSRIVINSPRRSPTFRRRMSEIRSPELMPITNSRRSRGERTRFIRSISLRSGIGCTVFIEYHSVHVMLLSLYDDTYDMSTRYFRKGVTAIAWVDGRWIGREERAELIR